MRRRSRTLWVALGRSGALWDAPVRSGTRAAEPRAARASEVGPNWSHFKFKGRRQKDTAVTDAKGIIEVVMLLQGQQAARVRRPTSGGPQGAEGSKFCALSRTHLRILAKSFNFCAFSRTSGGQAQRRTACKRSGGCARPVLYLPRSGRDFRPLSWPRADGYARCRCPLGRTRKI